MDVSATWIAALTGDTEMAHMLVSEKAVDDMNEELSKLHADLAKEREKVKELDTGFDQALRERDAAEAIGTRLAEAVGEHFRVEVGECSNMNDPREMAIAILEGEYQTDSDADRKLAAAQAAIAEMREALEEIGNTACGEASHQYIALTALALTTNQDALHEARALECERLAKKSEQGMLLCNELIEEAAAHRAKKEGV